MAAGTDGKSRIAAAGDKTVSQLYNKKESSFPATSGAHSGFSQARRQQRNKAYN
jgi:hypothetical protein